MRKFTKELTKKQIDKLTPEEYEAYLQFKPVWGLKKRIEARKKREKIMRVHEKYDEYCRMRDKRKQLQWLNRNVEWRYKWLQIRREKEIQIRIGNGRKHNGVKLSIYDHATFFDFKRMKYERNLDTRELLIKLMECYEQHNPIEKKDKYVYPIWRGKRYNEETRELEEIRPEPQQEEKKDESSEDIRRETENNS